MVRKSHQASSMSQLLEALGHSLQDLLLVAQGFAFSHHCSYQLQRNAATPAADTHVRNRRVFVMQVPTCEH
ncbi:unnamed protein product [Pleuronectes platessa]|uniref:Uncharacterized protein n=1 Tax=Pleuronectes platessa TaxID=8262 RepID=A0A9N7UMU4_PLEPL|nr:unnamed protein product [Pleuronectes platessa]